MLRDGRKLRYQKKIFYDVSQAVSEELVEQWEGRRAGHGPATPCFASASPASSTARRNGPCRAASRGTSCPNCCGTLANKPARNRMANLSNRKIVFCHAESRVCLPSKRTEKTPFADCILLRIMPEGISPQESFQEAHVPKPEAVRGSTFFS